MKNEGNKKSVSKTYVSCGTSLGIIESWVERLKLWGLKQRQRTRRPERSNKRRITAVVITHQSDTVCHTELGEKLILSECHNKSHTSLGQTRFL